MKRVAVFASGSGSNFEAIVQACREQSLQFEVVLLFSDKEQAYALERAKNLNIPAHTFSPKNFPDKNSYEKEIVKLLEDYEVEFIALAGYMRLVGPLLLNQYFGKIINIHPSLLPSFPGKDAIGQAIKKGVKITGVTIHYVDSGMDTGPIIAQEAVEVNETDTYETLQKKIQKIEHELYPKIIDKLLRKDDKYVIKASTN